MSEMHFPQIGFLEVEKTISGSLELFPTFWQALEGIASPDIAERNASLDVLLESHVSKLSPLVAYLLATRLIDPNINFRQRIIEAMGNIIAPDGGPAPTPEVRRHLKGHCNLIGRGTVLAILEVAATDSSVDSHITSIFNLCSHSGTILIDLMAERKVPVSVRRQAMNFIGLVGFIEAIPYLERLVDRLTSRANGQKRMPFAPPSEPDESTLISVAQTTLAMLNESSNQIMK
jgi:hypothetical protein